MGRAANHGCMRRSPLPLTRRQVGEARSRLLALSRNFANPAIFIARFSRRFSMGIWEAPQRGEHMDYALLETTIAKTNTDCHGRSPDRRCGRSPDRATRPT